MSVGNIEQLFVAQSAAAGDGVNIVAPFAGAGEVQLGGSFLVLVAPSKVDSPLHGSIVLCSYNCVDIVAVIVVLTRWNGSIDRYDRTVAGDRVSSRSHPIFAKEVTSAPNFVFASERFVKHHNSRAGAVTLSMTKIHSLSDKNTFVKYL